MYVLFLLLTGVLVGFGEQAWAQLVMLVGIMTHVKLGGLDNARRHAALVAAVDRVGRTVREHGLRSKR